jgi:hypothetical protein
MERDALQAGRNIATLLRNVGKFLPEDVTSKLREDMCPSFLMFILWKCL